MLTFNPEPAPTPGVPTLEEWDAYDERQLHLLHLPGVPEREAELASVGTCSYRRECHLYSPWTDPQRRVKLVWSGMDVPDDAGAAAYYAWALGKPYPYKDRKRKEIPSTGRKRTKMSAEATETGDMHANGRLDDDVMTMGGSDLTRGGETRQTRMDQAEAQPGTAWLRGYSGANARGTVERALAVAGLTVESAVEALSAKGKPTRTAKVVRDAALGALCGVCPDLVPVAYVAEVFGMHRVNMSTVLTKAREAKSYTPAS